MSSIRTSRYARGLSYLVLIALAVPLTPIAMATAHAQPSLTKRKVLVFRLTDEANVANVMLIGGGPARDPRQLATDALLMALDQINPASLGMHMESTEFVRSSPLVRRAVNEGRILPTQLESGPISVRDAIGIGHALDVDTVVLGSIQSYRATQNPRGVEIVLSGQAYDVLPNFDTEVGEPVEKPTITQAFGVVGSSKRLPGYKGGDAPLVSEAIDDAAYRAAKIIGGRGFGEVAESKPPEKKENKTAKWLAYAAAIGLIAWLISSSGGPGEGSPSPDAIPPTPLPLQAEGTDTIRISWVAPTGTSLTLLRYQIQRSVDNGPYTYFGTGGASQNVGASLTQYSDFDVSTGHSYSYRIRTVYTNSHFSIWVPFSGITI